MTNENETNFDLPELESNSPTLKIHTGPGDSACTSCEG